MRTLYVSDLDGTLLGADERLSPYSIETINALVATGMHFTIATARALHSTRVLLRDVDLRAPLICMNGALIVDPATGATLRRNGLRRPVAETLVEAHLRRDVHPFVFTIDDAGDYHAYYLGITNTCERRYVSNRIAIGDKRFRQVADLSIAFSEDVLSVIAIDTRAALLPVAELVAADPDLYGHMSTDLIDQVIFWLETLHPEANKGSAIRFAAEHIGADRLVCFGDNINDLPMFAEADEAYAVAGAVPELRGVATAVIGAHTDDGVARFLRNISPATVPGRRDRLGRRRRH